MKKNYLSDTDSDCTIGLRFSKSVNFHQLSVFVLHTVHDNHQHTSVGRKSLDTLESKQKGTNSLYVYALSCCTYRLEDVFQHCSPLVTGKLLIKPNRRDCIYYGTTTLRRAHRGKEFLDEIWYQGKHSKSV